FKMRTGQVGVLQVLSMADDGSSVRVRDKLIQPVTAATQPASQLLPEGTPLPTTQPAAAKPEVGEFYVMGQVERPGVYSLTGRRVTIKQALAAAGLKDSQNVSKGSLIRRIEGDKEQTFPL